MGGSSKSQTVGYRYFMGLHFGICHGPVDALQEVRAGDRQAWLGNITTNESFFINYKKLFGGEEKEGGLVGTVDVMMGGPTQTPNAYLQSKLGAVPAFRGILSAVYRGQVSANNPYIKPWAFRVKRILQGWDGGSAWNPTKATIAGVRQLAIKTPFTESFNEGLAPYTLQEGTLGQFSIVSDAYGNALRVNSNSVRNRISRPVDPSLFLSASFKVKVLSRGTNDDGLIEFRGDTPDGIVFAFNAGRQNSTDPLHRPTFGFVDQPGSVGNPLGTEATALGVWYQFTATYDAAAETFTVTLTNISTGAVHGSATVNVNLSTPINSVHFRTDGSGGGNVVWDDVNITLGEGVPVDSMNPAHIVYECLTNTAWGMGYPSSAIDDASFTAAAETLFGEAFGLCLIWNRQDTIESFIQIVLDHAGGILYVDPTTGRFALKLIRDDYDRDTLPVFGPSNLVAVNDFQRQAWGETTNELTVVFRDFKTNKDSSVTIQDLANIQTQGAVVAQTRQYPGLPTASLAQRIAQRDLNALSTPLARARITANRSAWNLIPGGVFRLTWPDYGVDDVVFRVLEVNRGTLQNGTITIDAVEDVFGLPDNTYVIDQPSEFVDPTNEPAPAPFRKLLEAPYWDLALSLSAADLDYLDDLSGYLQTLAARPSGDALSYAIHTKVGAAAYEQEATGQFCPTATLSAAITKTTTAITFGDQLDTDDVEVGGYAMIGNEYIGITAIDAVAGTATITRGLLDTVPADHAAGARIWFADGFQGIDETEYADTEVVDVKLLPRTGLGDLELDDAPADSLTMARRHNRPYPPGNFRINAAAYPVEIIDDPVLTATWSHRDRLTQTAYLVTQGEGNIGPEAGTTYTVQLWNHATNTLIEEFTGVAGTSQAFAALAGGVYTLRIDLWSVRGGVASYQKQSHVFTYINVDILNTEDLDRITTEAGDQIELE